MLLRIFFLILFAFSLISCTSTKSNGVIYHNQFDFSQVKTYGFYPLGSDFTEVQSLSYSLRNSIEIAIEKAMDKQAFSYAKLDAADIVVTYHLLTGKSKDYSRYNKTVLFCQHCLKANTWHQSDNSIKLSKGSLILDLVDPKKNRSVWRSAQPLSIKDKDNSREVNQKIQQAVEIMLSQYPKTNLTSTKQ